MAGSGTVFRTQEFWAAPLPQDGGEHTELNVDMQALGIVHLPSHNENFIVIGTYTGRLRVYRPCVDPFSERDVMLDTTLKHPILGVQCDHPIVGGQTANIQPLIAVLHPNILAIYKLEVSSGDDPADGDDGESTQGLVVSLKKLHEHDLQASAANMVYGRFREAQGGGLSVCVQSMGSKISVWEKGQRAFTASLGSLVPGPLCFVPSTVSFVSISAACDVESFKLIKLMSLESSKEKATCDWSVNLGEDALQVEYVQTDPPTLVVLGVNTVFWLEDHGAIRHTKRLEGAPSCMHVYGACGRSGDVLVAMHTHHVVVLRDARVLWAAGVDAVPIALTVATLAGQRGMIVAMDETGGVGCYYLGTDPVMTVQPTYEDRDVDYETLDQQMAELQTSIREIVLAEQPTASQQSAINPISVTATVTAAKCEAGGTATVNISATVAVNEGAAVGDVDVCLVTSSSSAEVHPPFVLLKANSVSVAGTRIQATVTCRDIGTFSVRPSVFVDVIATPRDSSRGAVGSYRLRLPWVHDVVPVDMDQIGDATGSELVLVHRQQKFTAMTSFDHDATVGVVDVVDINVHVSEVLTNAGPLVSPVELLSARNALEVASLGPRPSTTMSSTSSVSKGAAVLDMPDGTTAVVTLTDAATYTVSVDAIGALGVALVCLEQAIACAYPQHPVPRISAQDVPCEAYFRVIENHFVARQDLNELYKALDKQAEQIRVVQKRLMTRYTDKTPAPLHALDSLLDTAYHSMLEVAENAEAAQKALARANGDVAAATRAMVQILRLCHSLDDENTSILESALCMDTENWTEDEGWEEHVDAALVFLLKKHMSSQPRDINRVDAFDIPEDVEPLKRHFLQLCDKLAQGVRLDGKPK